ncbi:hypothetical protein [Oceanomicrobium pacificus]|uniref:Uncharacterized protein n=1 Tax=Oceanomicrobium pacificus TaxID=2692916 RepID=A0A6B0TWR7_9RHOB|nr:hypothetical protein [Oceanomicrobium pacificus]MXU65948.1 hypothetical protein [Oceanomicrobium pacificus]
MTSGKAVWLDGFPETLRPWLAALTPLLNIAILAFLCRQFGHGESKNSKAEE